MQDSSRRHRNRARRPQRSPARVAPRHDVSIKPEDIPPYIEEHWSPEAAGGFDREIESYPFDVNGRRVLDLGAGPGGYTAALVRAGAELVVWQDVDAAFLAVARARMEATGRVRFERRDMLDLPYEKGSFDVVALRGALHWASDENAVIARLGELVGPGGWLVLTGLNFRRPLVTVRPWWRAAAHVASPVVAFVLRRKPVTTLWVFERLTRRRLARAGFVVVEWRRPISHYFTAICRRAHWLPADGEKAG